MKKASTNLYGYSLVHTGAEPNAICDAGAQQKIGEQWRLAGLAMIHTKLGNLDVASAAFEWFDKAFDLHDPPQLFGV